MLKQAAPARLLPVAHDMIQAASRAADGENRLRTATGGCGV